MCPDALIAPAQPVTMPEPDGYVVVASKLCTGSVVPPYRHQHWHEWCADEEAVGNHCAALDRGEYDGWREVAVIPTFGGIPRPEQALSISRRIKLVREAEAA